MFDMQTIEIYRHFNKLFLWMMFELTSTMRYFISFSGALLEKKSINR